MNLFDLIKKESDGKDSHAMWSAVKRISDFLDNCEIDKEGLMKNIFEDICGGHFNEEFAKEQIAKLYYYDEGVKKIGPFWSADKMHQAFDTARCAIPSVYNEWDFWVTLSMIKSDFQNLLEDWFPEKSDEQLFSSMIDLAVNFLNDEDSRHPNSKIWAYFN